MAQFIITADFLLFPHYVFSKIKPFQGIVNIPYRKKTVQEDKIGCVIPNYPLVRMIKIAQPDNVD